MKASCVVFALIQIQASYWAMTFIVMILLPVLDIAYTVANMQVCSSFPAHSQALAGSIFSVATRVSIATMCAHIAVLTLKDSWALQSALRSRQPSPTLSLQNTMVVILASGRPTQLCS